MKDIQMKKNVFLALMNYWYGLSYLTDILVTFFIFLAESINESMRARLTWKFCIKAQENTYSLQQCLEVSIKREFQIHIKLLLCDNDLGFFCLLHQPYEFSLIDCQCNTFLYRKEGWLRNAVTVKSHDVVSIILRGGQI